MQIKEVDVEKTEIFSIGRQYSHNVLVIHFVNLPDIKNKYIYYKIDDIEEEIPLVSDLFIVSRPLTMHSGKVKAQIIVRDEANETIGLTKNFTMIIKASNYSGIGEDENYPDDLNIKNYFVKIDEKVNSFEELANLVQTKLDNGEFIGAQGPKGDPGEKGDPGDVTEEYRNLANQIAQNATSAQTSATNAQVSATNAQKALNDTKEFANQTKTELNQIKTDTSALKDEVKASAVNAKASETKAKEYANNLQASTDDISQLKEDIEDLSFILNLFDSSTIVNNEYYGSDGTTSHTDSTVTKAQRAEQYISIKTGATYTWSGNTKLLINTYDANKQNIERLITYAGEGYTSKVFNSNVRYVRLSTINDIFGTNYFMFVEGDKLPTKYVPYNSRFIRMDKVYNLVTTLENKFGYIESTDKTDFNEIKSSGYYVITKIDYSNAPTSNSSGLLMVLTGYPNGYQTYQIFSQYKNGRTYIRNQRGDLWGDWTEITNLKESILGVNKIAWFGDSISALKDLPSKCSDLIGCNVVNCTIPGAVMVQNVESNLRYTKSGFYNLMNCLKTGDYTSVDEAYNSFITEDPQDAYAPHLLNFKNMDWGTISTVVVFYGTNDYYHGVITLDEYKQKMKEAFTNLMSKYPTLQIYAITPTWRADGNVKNKQNLVLYDYVQATIDVCSELNITCYNLYNNSGINSYTKGTLLISDGLHLTDSGAKLLSEKLSRFLLSN